MTNFNGIVIKLVLILIKPYELLDKLLMIIIINLSGKLFDLHILKSGRVIEMHPFKF